MMDDKEYKRMIKISKQMLSGIRKGLKKADIMVLFSGEDIKLLEEAMGGGGIVLQN